MTHTHRLNGVDETIAIYWFVDDDGVLLWDVEDEELADRYPGLVLGVVDDLSRKLHVRASKQLPTEGLELADIVG